MAIKENLYLSMDVKFLKMKEAFSFEKKRKPALSILMAKRIPGTVYLFTF